MSKRLQRGILVAAIAIAGAAAGIFIDRSVLTEQAEHPPPLEPAPEPVAVVPAPVPTPEPVKVADPELVPLVPEPSEPPPVQKPAPPKKAPVVVAAVVPAEEDEPIVPAPSLAPEEPASPPTPPIPPPAPVKEEGHGGSPPESGWALIASPDVSPELSAETVQRLFAGDSVVVEDDQILQVVLGPVGSRARRQFMSNVVGKTESEFKASWTKLVFRGGGVRPPLIVSRESDVVKEVARRPGTIGLVPADLDLSGVRRVAIR
jgi:hypothetical protein